MESFVWKSKIYTHFLNIRYKNYIEFRHWLLKKWKISWTFIRKSKKLYGSWINKKRWLYKIWNLRNNGSLFDVFLATVKENNEENEMSSKFAFSRLKMGEVESRVTLETRRVERGYPCLRPPHFWPRKCKFCEFHFIHLFFFNVAR